jgi:hypothetical protein
MGHAQKGCFYAVLLDIRWKNDNAIPVGGSVGFAEEVKNRFGDEIVDLRLEPGEHGIDTAALNMTRLGG